MFPFSNKVIKNISWLVGGRVFQMVISLFISMITARFLGPENFGVLGYVTSFTSFFSSFCLLGLDGIIIKELVNNKNAQGEIIGSAIIMRLVISAISIPILVGLIYLLHPGDMVLVWVALFSSISLLFQSFDIIKYFFQSRLQAKIATVLSTVAYLGMIVFKIAILVMGKTVEWFAFAATLNIILMAMLLLFAYFKYDGKKLSFSLGMSKKLISQSYHFIISAVMISIYAQTDKIMIGQLLDNLEVGYYTTAVTINVMWAFVPSAIIESLRPVIMETKERDNVLFNKRTKQLYAILIWISILVGIVVTIFSNWIVLILYGKDYLPAASVLSIVVWYSSFSYLGAAKNIWLICEGKQKYEKWFTFCGAITNIVLNIILIPNLGIIGAAFATLITQIATNFIYPMIPKDTRHSSKLIIEAFLLKDVIDKESVKYIYNKIRKR